MSRSSGRGRSSSTPAPATSSSAASMPCAVSSSRSTSPRRRRARVAGRAIGQVVGEQKALAGAGGDDAPAVGDRLHIHRSGIGPAPRTSPLRDGAGLGRGTRAPPAGSATRTHRPRRNATRRAITRSPTLRPHHQPAAMPRSLCPPETPQTTPAGKSTACEISSRQKAPHTVAPTDALAVVCSRMRLFEVLCDRAIASAAPPGRRRAAGGAWPVRRLGDVLGGDAALGMGAG